MNKSKPRLKILHLLLVISETSMPYNEFSLAMSVQQDITICTYFPSTMTTPSNMSTTEGDGTIPGFFKALRGALTTGKHDVIHVHSPHLGVLFLIASTLFQTNTPKICTVHNSYQNFKLRNRLLFIPVFAFFDKIVCCSGASFASFPVFYKWLSGVRLEAIPNGVDISRIDRDGRGNIPQEKCDEFTVVSLGRLNTIKNPQVALDAFLRVNPSGKMLFIGEGNLRVQLHEKINKRLLQKNVVLLGLIPRNDVFKYLGEASVFISTSKGEGLPVAVLEAMACRCPVILSDIPPHREIADGADFIPLIHPNDIEAFAQEIQRFRSMSKPERVAIGERCRKLVETKHSLTTMLKKYEQVYSELIQTNH